VQGVSKGLVSYLGSLMSFRDRLISNLPRSSRGLKGFSLSHFLGGAIGKYSTLDYECPMILDHVPSYKDVLQVKNN